MSMFEDILIQISKNLKEISKSLKESVQINKARLELEKAETEKDNEYMEGSLKSQKVIVEKIKKDEKFAKDILKKLGIPEEIDIDGIELGDDSK